MAAVRGPGPQYDPERIAHNETTYRRINEAIERGRQNRDGVVGFVCECGQLGCNAVIELTIDEYEAVRSDPTQFAIARGHETAADRVVGDGGRFSRVVKVEGSADVAHRTDPRSGAR